MLANYHTHTFRCKHAYGTEREYVEQSISAGFKILGFSDHVPQPYPENFCSNIRMGIDELPDYTGTLVSLREEYKDRLKILIGYEVEYSEKYFSELIPILKKYPLDYIILGQHFVPDEIEGFYAGNPTADDEKLKAYVELTIKGLETGLFTYLAHPDLINFTGEDTVYIKHMKRLAEAAVDLHIPLEINMYGWLLKRNYPCDRFFSMASKMGAKFVVGCDAHKADVLRQIDLAPGLSDFLKRNDILIGDNIVPLQKV